MKKNVEIDLFIQCGNEENLKAVLSKVTDIGKWEKVSSSILRGWVSMDKDHLETYLYEECGFDSDTVKVVNGNPGLWMIH